MFLKNKNISSKIKRSKVTDYAALIDDLQNKYLQQLHLLALHLEIEGYTTLLLYLLLEFLSTGDLREERRTFKWRLKRAEPETHCKLILVAKMKFQG